MARILKSDAERLLGNVADEYVFHCCDGSVFRNMRELCDGLTAMSGESFTFHADENKNDFSQWVQDIIRDEKLSRDLRKSVGQMQAARGVKTRINFLSDKLRQ